MRQGHEIPMKGGDEYDALTTWRKVMCYLAKPGVAKKIKRGYNKRARHQAKEGLRKSDHI